MINKKTTSIDNSSWVYEWPSFKEEDCGDSLLTVPFSNISAQITGDFENGSVIKFECSNDEKNWNDVSDNNDNLINVYEASIVCLPVDYLYIRPCFIGASEEGINVTIFGKGKK